MVQQVKVALIRSPHTLALDFVGGASLVVILVGGLYLPGLF